MKYLLGCPACNSRIPVETGQAGKTIQCGCGRSLEVPSIRGLRSLAQVAEDRPAAPTWTKRKGLAFLGSAIAIGAVVAAGAVLALRPSVYDAGSKIQVNEEAIRSEVAALSPAEGIERLQMADTPLPTPFSEQQKQGQVPEYLRPCTDLLVDFEGPGTVAIARQQAGAVMKQIAERNDLLRNRQAHREALNDWLLPIGIVFVAGLVTAGSAFLVGKPRPRGPDRPAVARARSE